MALLVVACGCRIAASSAMDATVVRGDGGLPERMVADAALWLDLLPISDMASDGRDGGASSVADSGVDRAVDAASGADGGAVADGALAGETGLPGDGACDLLGALCVGSEACYPYPFEAAIPGDARCAFQGVGSVSVPCQSQVDCDGLTLCSAPGQPESICLQRCNLANPRCPTGWMCQPYFRYTGVGVCLLL